MHKTIKPGDIFGKLVVVKCVGFKPGLVSKINYYRCLCLCGNMKDIRRNHLLAKKTVSCGCHRRTLKLNPPGKTAHNILYSVCKQSAKSRNLTFTLTLEEHTIIISKDCTYCGSPPRLYRDVKANGIDRVNSSEGYTLSNSVSACFRCNRAKKDYSVEDFLTHARKIVLYQDKSQGAKNGETNNLPNSTGIATAKGLS